MVALALPARAWMLVSIVLGSVLLYAMRVNISIALNSDAGMADRYGWGDHEKGQILSAFLFGYFVMNIVGGELATRSGGHTVANMALVGAAFFSAITPVCADHFGKRGVIVVRFFCGLSEGSWFPACYQMLMTWMPFTERGVSASAMSSGNQVGTIAMWALGPYLVKGPVGWPGTFYVPAGLTLLWSVVWRSRWSSSPENNPWVTPSELEHILATRDAPDPDPETVERRVRPTKRQAFTSPVFFGAVTVSLVACFGFYTLLTFLPQYMEYQLGLSLKGSGSLSVLPYVSLAVFKIGAGILSDRMIKRWRCSLPFTRKLMSAVATFGPAMALACVPSTTNPDITIALFAAAMAASGFQISGSDLALADLFSEHMGAVYGVMNGIGSLAGAAAPLVIGQLTSSAGCVEQSDHPHQTEKCDGAWATVFYLAAALYAFGGVAFMLVGSCDPGYRADERYTTRTPKGLATVEYSHAEASNRGSPDTEPLLPLSVNR